ncbi:protein NO VEIN domain-containing protein [Actinokineospora sp. NPDC004072]
MLGHRSTFVGAVLATLPGARFTMNPVMVTTEPEGASPDPDVMDAVLDAERAAGRTRRQGRGLTAAEKTAVERRAMEVAGEHLVGQGWDVEDVGATRSYDIDATRGEEHLFVEVKGTTSAGEEVVLTRREVELMTDEYPHTMLIVVHGIELDRSGETPVARGGVLDVYHPWRVEPERLTPISYQYRTEKVSSPSGG